MNSFECVGRAEDAGSLLTLMQQNQPGVVTVDSSEWFLSKLYLDDSGLFNTRNFISDYGHYIIPVQSTDSSYSCGRADMPLCELLDRILSGESLYGKDWHFLLPSATEKINSPYTERFPIFEPPAAVKEDWLNWYSDVIGKDDFRFLYIGGPASRTGFHFDVLCSYSWSVNIIGRKLWKFWLPKDIPDLNTTEENMQLMGKEPFLEFIQDINQLVFVPSGWFHTVENLGASDCPRGKLTISINHNWINGFNLYNVWEFLLNELGSVHREMECFLGPDDENLDPTLMCPKEWNEHCEKIMRANCSFSVVDFIELLSGRLLYVLYSNECGKSSSSKFVAPEWASLFCPSVTLKKLSLNSSFSWFETSCNTFLDSYTSACECIHFKETGHEKFTREHMSEYVLSITGIELLNHSKLSIPCFGVLESIRIFKELQCYSPVLTHLNTNLSTPDRTKSDEEVDLLIQSMVLSAISFVESSLRNCV